MDKMGVRRSVGISKGRARAMPSPTRTAMPSPTHTSMLSPIPALMALEEKEHL